MFKAEINYLAHHVSKRGVLPSKKNLEAIAQCPPPDTYIKVKSFVGLVGHYRCFIKGFANIATPLYDLTSGENKDKKSEHLDLPQEAREAFDHLKATCLQAPILRHLVELAVAATTEEGYPQMLPHMAIGCGRVLIHHVTIWAECYLLLLVVIIIDGHLGQAFHL